MELAQEKKVRVGITIGIVLISFIAIQLFVETCTANETTSKTNLFTGPLHQNSPDSKGTAVILSNTSVDTLCSSNCDYTW